MNTSIVTSSIPPFGCEIHNDFIWAWASVIASFEGEPNYATYIEERFQAKDITTYNVNVKQQKKRGNRILPLQHSFDAVFKTYYYNLDYWNDERIMTVALIKLPLGHKRVNTVHSFIHQHLLDIQE